MEELVIFDILTRPILELSSEELAEIKKMVRELLEKLEGYSSESVRDSLVVIKHAFLMSDLNVRSAH